MNKDDFYVELKCLKTEASELEYNADQCISYLNKTMKVASRLFDLINKVESIYLLKEEEYFKMFKEKINEVDRIDLLHKGD